MKKSEGEEKFARLWREYCDLALEREVRFHPERRWSFDFAFRKNQFWLAVEIQGAVWVPGRGHSSGAGISRDCEKTTEAVLLGWRVVPLTTGQVTKDRVKRIVEFCKLNNN